MGVEKEKLWKCRFCGEYHRGKPFGIHQPDKGVSVLNANGSENQRHPLKNEKTEKPLTIGIDAAWGMGKTTLMQMVRDQLAEQDAKELNADE